MRPIRRAWTGGVLLAALLLLTQVGRSERPRLAAECDGLDRSVPEVKLSEQPSRSADDLAGGWQAFLPAGFEQRVQLVRIGENEYRLKPHSLTFSGVYRRCGESLEMIEAHDRGQTGFEWKIRSSHFLTLVRQTASTGSDYTSAVLFRSADKKGK